MKYLLDANIFIQAKNLHYGMDFCPAFWEWLVTQNAKENVFSIEKVGDELKNGNDELANWAAERGKAFFLPPDDKVLSALGQISNCVTESQYDLVAVNTFFQAADYYLVAHALSVGCTVVTHESPSNGCRKIKIPNVCSKMNITCITPYQMLRAENVRFVLGAIRN